MVLFLIINGNIYNRTRQIAYGLLKDMSSYRLMELSKGIDSLETSNFIIKSSQVNDKTVEHLGKLLEKSYDLVGREFNYFPQNRTLVFIYASMEELWARNKSFKGESIMGFYHLGVIHIVAPEVFYMDLYEYERNGPILHEYTHKVIDDLSYGNVEIWFTEGLALYQEYKHYDNEWARGLYFDREYSFDELRKDFMTLESVQAYKQSFQIIKEFYDSYGTDGIIEILNKLKTGSNMNDALLSIY